MKCDCHVHMVLSGSDWREAVARHRERPEDAWIRETLQTYAAAGFTYLRDGGDRWGVCLRAKTLAPEYGITYASPGAPICKAGHYGSFIGLSYGSMGEFRQLVTQMRDQGADFIKIMISGLMDFSRFGVLTQPGLAAEEIRELVRIAHGEGLAVMAHANGARTVEAAALAGVDSVEHGAYLDAAALQAIAESGTIWVPTLSAVGNLLGKGRFPDEEVQKILTSAMENIRRFAGMGGNLAPGSDAGAWAVSHGGMQEYLLMQQALGEETDAILEQGGALVRSRFQIR